MVQNDFVTSLSRAAGPSVGGKALGLAALHGIRDIHVPPGFVVSGRAYRELIACAGVAPLIRQLDTYCEAGPLAERIRETLIAAPFPSRAVDEIRGHCERLRGDLGLVAVRSSANVEDTAAASYAGVFTSFLNVATDDEVLSCYKRCCTAVFTERARQYARAAEIRLEDIEMAVIVQAMVSARTSGTAFTRDLRTGGSGITIEASFGLGESLVSGEIVPDRYVLNANPDHIVIARLLSREKSPSPESSATPGDRPLIVTPEPSCLDRATALLIGEHVKRIAAALGHTVDVEWALDGEGQLWFLQVRPLTSDLRRETVAYLHGVGDPPLVSGGDSIVPGVVVGKVRRIKFYDPSRETAPWGVAAVPDNADVGGILAITKMIDKGDVLVANKTLPQLEAAMGRAATIITEQGGITCHAAVIARELGTPAIVGMHGALDLLGDFEGRVVTVDATAASVYSGDQSASTRVGPPAELVTRQFGDAALAETVRRLAAEMYELDYNWFGRPTHRLGRLQLALYNEGFDRLERRLGGIRIKRLLDGGLLKTSSGDDAMINAAIEWEGISRLFAERVAAVARCERAVRGLTLATGSLTEFFDAYAQMIAHFHLRWQLAHLAEIAYLRALLLLPLDQRPVAQHLFETKVTTHRWSVKQRRHLSELAAALNAGDRVHALERHGRRYPPTDNVDWRRGPPSLEDLERAFAPIREQRIPPLYVYQSDLWESFNQGVRDAIHLNASQAVQRLKEPFFQLRVQFRVRRKLLRIGGDAQRAGLLRAAEDVFDATPLTLLHIAGKLTRRTHSEKETTPK